jgi:hypothetical protein
MKRYIRTLRSVLKNDDYERVMSKNALSLCGLNVGGGKELKRDSQKVQ